MTSNAALKNMTFDQLLDSRIESIINERGGSQTPELIRLDEARDICECDISVITSLFKDSQNNGFPAVKLAPKTFRVDKQRLILWLRNGGLDGINKKTS